MPTPEEEAQRRAQEEAAKAAAAAQASAQAQAQPAAQAPTQPGVGVAGAIKPATPQEAMTDKIEDIQSGGTKDYWDSAVGAVKGLGNVSDLGSGAMDALGMGTTKISPYDPNPQNFQMLATPQGATALANAYDAQKVQAQQSGALARDQMGGQAAVYGAQGAGIQAQQGAVAGQNVAQGGANAAAMGASAQDFNRLGTNANFRSGTQVGYGSAQAYGSQFDRDQAAARGLVGGLMDYSRQGPGPSAAEAQLQMGSDRAQLQNLSLARSGRGMGQNAAALRQAVSANSDVQAQTNQQAALLRAQESDAWRGRQLQAMGQAQAGQQAVGAQGLQARGLTAQEAQFQGSLSDAQRARNDAAAMGYAQLGQGAQQFGMSNELAYNQLAAQNLGQGYQYGLGYNQLGQQALGQGMTYDLGAQQLGQQYAQMGLRTYEDQLAAAQAYEQLRSGNYMQAHTFNAGAADANKNGIMGMVGTGLSLLSDIDMKKNIQPLDDNPVLRQSQSIQQGYQDMLAESRKPKEESGGLLSGILSDERSKREMRQLESERDSLLAALGGSGPAVMPQRRPESTGRFPDESVRALGQSPQPDFRPAQGYSYEYKDPGAPGAAPGKQVGPMAQDLQHIPGVVKETPRGLAVDGGRLTMANTAALSQQQRKNEALAAELAKLQAEVDAMGQGGRAVYPMPQQPQM